MKKRILFECRSVAGVRKAWETYGYEVYEPETELAKQPKEKIEEILEEYQKSYEISYVFSFDFFPVIADCCNQLGLGYVSWILDCPHIMLWSESAEYINNYIFVFDYCQYEMLLRRGLNNVYYLPLCADIDNFDLTIRSDAGKGKEQYGCDVSFVANLYNDSEHNLFDQIAFLPQYERGYLDALMKIQRKIWGADFLLEAVNGNINGNLKKYVNFGTDKGYAEGAFEVMFANILGQKIAQLERIEVCSYLARNFQFSLYTGSDTSFDTKIRNCGHADYVKEMPLIFHYSKINIHITLRSITSGMSLRVLDVLACGGFLLTNYQPEIAEYFADGEELVMYHSFEDMYEKINYYLEHEEERKKIALAGYRKVKEQFNYIKGFGEIVKIMEELYE